MFGRGAIFLLAHITLEIHKLFWLNSTKLLIEHSIVQTSQRNTVEENISIL
jgi:hypothetical protein